MQAHILYLFLATVASAQANVNQIPDGQIQVGAQAPNIHQIPDGQIQVPNAPQSQPVLYITQSISSRLAPSPSAAPGSYAPISYPSAIPSYSSGSHLGYDSVSNSYSSNHGSGYDSGYESDSNYGSGYGSGSTGSSSTSGSGSAGSYGSGSGTGDYDHNGDKISPISGANAGPGCMPEELLVVDGDDIFEVPAAFEGAANSRGDGMWGLVVLTLMAGGVAMGMM